MVAEPPVAQSPSVTLCVACGFCCDGTLFGSTRIDRWEKPELQRLGFRVIVRADGEVGFTQPCVALVHEPREGERLDVAHVCRHYEGRPQTCRLFRCRVLVALEDGELGLDEALAEVAEAHARVTRLGAVLPADGDEGFRSIAQRGRALRASGEPMGVEVEAAQRALEELLDRRFRRPTIVK